MTVYILIGVFLLIFAVVFSALRRSLQRQESFVQQIVKGRFKTKEHQERWNVLWYDMCSNFGIGFENGVPSGSQDAKELFKMMKTEFGRFDKEQIDFMIALVSHLSKVAKSKKCYSTYDLMRDPRLKPSVN